MKFLYFFLLLKEIILTLGLVNINIDATGLLIPYSIGALGYIKKHLNICNYHLTGISGGSFASIIYHLEDDLSNHDKIWNKLIGDDNYIIKFDKNLDEFQELIKYNMLYSYKNVDMNKFPISIIVSKINNMMITNEKINNFSNFEELIDYCMCSSYIPYICGKTFSKKYKNSNYIDGVIFKNLNHFNCKDKCEKSIYIHKNMAKRVFDLNDYLYLDKNKSQILFNYGWNDYHNIYKNMI